MGSAVQHFLIRVANWDGQELGRVSRWVREKEGGREGKRKRENKEEGKKREEGRKREKGRRKGEKGGGR